MLIDIIACVISDNLAFRKQTSQSSEEHGGVSSRAVDGISDPNWVKGSCTLIDGEHNPWWRVDLGQVEPVSEVYLVSQAEVWHFEIRVGGLDDFLKLCY